MRRVLLFLLLAGGGLTGLSAAAGGFLGTGTAAPTPELPVVRDPPAAAEAPVHISDLPVVAASRGVKPPDFAMRKLRALDCWPNREREWVDSLTRERIVFPFYVEMGLHVDDLESYVDTATGTKGERWRGVRVTLMRDAGSLTRKEAEALQADPSTRRRLVLYEITAARGYANFLLEPMANGARAATPRTIIHLNEDVQIHVVREGTTIRTSDVTIDREAGTAEGSGDIVAENAEMVLRGHGFRLDRGAKRLEVLQQVEMDVRPLSDDGGAEAPLDLGTGPFRPRVLRTRGNAVVAQREGDDGAPQIEITLKDRVRVEGDGGSRLDADEVLLHAVRPASGHRVDDDVGPVAGGSRYRLTRMVAEGQVTVEGRQPPAAAGRPTPEFAIATTKLTSLFEANRLDRALLEGATTGRYTGSLSLQGGGEGERGTVVATCRDTLTYGPRLASAADTPACDAVLDLVGAAHVEGATAGPGEAPQVLDADRLRLFLRRRAAGTAATPSDPRAVAASPGSDMQAVGFVASGGDVRLGGPRLSGWAKEMHGLDLDQDAWRIVALGPDARLEVADDPAPARPRDGAKPAAPRNPRAASRKPWTLAHLEATRDVHGSLRPATGDAPLGFSAHALTYEEASGGVLSAAEGQSAVLTHAGSEGHEDRLEAPRIEFRTAGTDRGLKAQGGVSAVIWSGGTAAAKAPTAKGRRTVAVRAGSRIEVQGSGQTASRAAAPMTVHAHDGAAIETRIEGQKADFVTAGEITAVLAPQASSPAPEPTHTTSAERAPPSPDATATAPSRWTVACETLDLALRSASESPDALGALRALTARGHVDARSEGPGDSPGGGQHFEGETLEFDGTQGTGSLVGRDGARARVTLGLDALGQRLVSPRVDFAVARGTLDHARFAPPVSGLFHAVAKGKPEVERYVLRSDAGPLVVDPRGTVVTGTEDAPVVLTRTVRASAGKPFERPLTLTTPRLSIAAASGFGRGASDIESLVAEGPKTRVETGEPGKDFHRAMGDRLVYDRKTAVLRLTGRDGVYLVRPGFQGKVNWFTVDVRTGAPDSEGADVVLELAK